MPIIIVLLATIVAFLFGGPILSVATLLIGLIVVFPNVVGAIAAVIGTIILLSVLSVKFDISLGSLILIIPGIIVGIVGLIFLIPYIQGGMETLQMKNKRNLQRQQAEYKKLQDELGVKYSLVENDNKIVEKYIVEPNTIEVWEVLKNTLFTHGAMFNYEKSKTENNLIVLTNKLGSEMRLVKSESGIELIFKKFVFIPHFIKEAESHF